MQLLVCEICAHHNRAQARYCGACGYPLVAPGAEEAPLAPPPVAPGLAIGPHGRYRLHELIGKGGFGEAYLAEDVQLQRLCLIKRLAIAAEADPATARQISVNFAREAHLLARLNHPGHQSIPEIYEYLPREHCLVMKYITGQSLDRVLKRRAEPLPEGEALRFIRDVCAALEYMHAHAHGPILHRDLKPSNIMLDTTGRIWLIDFGLARSMPDGQPRPAPAEGAWGGTYGYMPPEQQRGQPTPRSDIFALGATLYELVTGRHPIRPGTPFVPAQQHNPRLRPEVDQVILRCMDRDPAARPQAGELLAILEDLLASANIPAPPEPIRPPEVDLLVGRDAAIAAIERLMAATRCVALVGMPGVGKTALAVTLARRRSHPDAIFWHRFHPGEGADLVLTRMAGWLARRRHPACWQQIQRHYQAGRPITPEIQAEYLAQTPGFGGCTLVLDDLHVIAANPAIAPILDRLRQAGAPDPPTIIVTSRSVLDRLTPEHIIPVQGLGPASVEALLSLRRLQLDAAGRDQLWRATEGNPQFLTLAIDALRGSGDPQRLLRHLVDTDQIGRYLLAQVDAQLTDPERAVMQAVAILLGYGGTRQAIEALLGGASLRRELAALVDRQLLKAEYEEIGASYAQHAMVQAFYYDLPGAHERRALHRRAGDYYAGAGRAPLSAARHYLQAGAHPQAAALLIATPWELFNQGHAGAVAELAAAIPEAALSPELRTALWTVHGEAAVILGDEATARRLLDQAQAAGAAEPPVRTARRFRLLAQLYEQRGDHLRAESCCRRGLELADQPGETAVRTETARLYTQLAITLMRTDDRPGAIRACQAGLAALPPEPATPGERAALLQRLATLEGLDGYESAIGALEQSLGLARQAGDQRLTAQVLHNLGHFCANGGRLDEATASLEESIRLRERIGDRAGTIDTLNTLGLVCLSRGDRAAAAQHYQAGCALAEQFGRRDSLAGLLLSIGQLHYEAGEPAEAEASLARGGAIFAELGEVGEQSRCLALRGDVALASGDPALARGYGRQALDLARRAGNAQLEACALRVLGEAALAMADPATAQADLARAWELMAAIGDRYDQALILGAQARLAFARDDIPAARHLARQSLELARANHIPHLVPAMEALLQPAGRSA